MARFLFGLTVVLLSIILGNLGVIVGYHAGSFEAHLSERAYTQQKDLLDERQKILELRERSIKEKEETANKWWQRAKGLQEEAEAHLKKVRQLQVD